MLEQHMDLWILFHRHQDSLSSLPVETLSFISYFHNVYRVKCRYIIFSFFECLEIFLVSDELLEILKGLDGWRSRLVDIVEWWVEAHRILLYYLHLVYRKLAFLHHRTNKNSFCSFHLISRRFFQGNRKQFV